MPDGKTETKQGEKKIAQAWVPLFASLPQHGHCIKSLRHEIEKE